MGGLFTGFYSKMIQYNPPKSLMVGLDSAGKTTILFKLKLGEVVMIIRYIIFKSFVCIQYQSINNHKITIII